MSGAFKDHFSSQAATYAAARPTYPGTLFATIAAQAPGQQLAVDCGTGNGQAALGLAEQFDRVIAIDASAAQIAHALRHPRVEYRVALAESTAIDASSVDALTVAQALHWFDAAAFFVEAQRILRPGGVLAIWTYARAVIHPELDAVVEYFYDHIVGPYWPPERVHVEGGYRGFEFPFPDESAPELSLTASWRFADLVAYFESWSATQRYRAALGHDPLDAVREDLERAWGDLSERKAVVWPLTLRIGRKPKV